MHKRRLQQIGILWLGGLLYALLGWASLRLALNQANASAVWPLAGLGIGLLARFGLCFWPTILIGSFLTNFLVNLQSGVAPWPAFPAAAGIALGNTAEALLGARLARHAIGNPPELRAVDGVFRFVLLAALIPPVLSAGCGVLSLQAAGILPAAMTADTWLTWFTGNVAGILTCAPLFFIGSFRISRWRMSGREALEGGIVLLALVLLGQAIGGMYFPELFPLWPKSYLTIPLVLWIACRYGRRAAVLSTLLLMATGVIGTMRGFAAFPSESSEQSLLSLQLFISVLAVIGLTVSVLVHQLRLKREALEAALADKSLSLAVLTRENAILTVSSVHELQSPLSGMRNLLQLVRRTPEIFAGPEGPGLLDDMQAAVERMFTLVTGALAIAHPKTDAGLAEATSPCDLMALLNGLVASQQALAGRKGIQIRVSGPIGSVVIRTQGRLLEHIVNNFLSNAAKFSDSGSLIFLNLEQTDREVIISVTDSGPGIAERDRAGIFCGGPSLSGARPTAGEASSGMGLFLSGELARHLGAKLTCKRAPGGGSIFAVSISTGNFLGH